MNNSSDFLRTPFRKLFPYNWVTGVALILLFAIPRFILVMHANVTKSYGSVIFIFLLMWIIPFLLLNKRGRRYIGMKKPDNWVWLFYSLIIGAAVCVASYLLFSLLYGNTVENAYVYMSAVNSPPGMEWTPELRQTFFLASLLGVMTFSPIGEELFYRGVVHGSFVSQFGEQKASMFDSLAFAVTHVAHFGVVYISGVWKFFPIPAILWIISMYILSRLLFLCKQKSGSIVGAIFAHAAFNAVMSYVIFYQIL